MPDPIDEFLNLVQGLSKKLAVAFEKGDVDEMGEIIGERQKLMDNFEIKPGDVDLNQSQKDLINETLRQDSLNMLAGEELKIFLKGKISTSKKLNTGLLEYVKSNNNLSSGQIMDKKR